jgi:hypothetical protein
VWATKEQWTNNDNTKKYYVHVSKPNIHTRYVKYTHFALAGNTRTTEHCTDDRALDASMAVTSTTPSSALCGKYVNNHDNQSEKKGIELFFLKTYEISRSFGTEI